MVFAMDTTQANLFGIEIETVGIDRDAIARAIQTVVGGTLDAYAPTVRMADGREWKVVSDGSLGYGPHGEIVSPKLRYDELDTLQSIVRAVRRAGARVDDKCGIHVHVDGSRFDVRGLLNLVNIVHKNERLIERALGVAPDRLARYTRALRAEFITRLEQRRPRTMSEFQQAWYGNAGAPSRYDHTRYHGLNLNSFFFRGTVEFRYFNGSLHAGEIKTYVQFCLALVHRAQTTKAASKARRVTQNDKWAVRVWLLKLGMIGDEFKTARFHMMKRLDGDSRYAAAQTASDAVAS